MILAFLANMFLRDLLINNKKLRYLEGGIMSNMKNESGQVRIFWEEFLKKYFWN